MSCPHGQWHQCEICYEIDRAYTSQSETIEQLQAKVAELEVENARLRTVPMKYRRMQFNAQLQDENAELARQLLLAQAYAEQLRAILLSISKPWSANSVSISEAIKKVSDTPRDTSALDAWVADKLAAEQQVGEWQPIETAPKGERFLTTTKLSDGSFGQVGISHSFFCYEVNTRDWKITGDDPGATHWMPLPTPPKRSMEGV